MALTRQRESAQVFVATETARDARQLARQMARGEVRAASVAWATADELSAAQRPRGGEGQRPRLARPAARRRRPNRAGICARRSASGGAEGRPPGRPLATAAVRASQAAGQGRRRRLAHPAAVSPEGETVSVAGWMPAASGRGAGGRAVQREREALMDYLRGGYRDPLAARARLDELVKREGCTSAAARFARGPEQLGELRGKDGFFAVEASRQERKMAMRAAGAVPGSLSGSARPARQNGRIVGRAGTACGGCYRYSAPVRAGRGGGQCRGRGAG